MDRSAEALRPLLVLYCGAGGMDTGLSRAGFTRIVGKELMAVVAGG